MAFDLGTHYANQQRLIEEQYRKEMYMQQVEQHNKKYPDHYYGQAPVQQPVPQPNKKLLLLKGK